MPEEEQVSVAESSRVAGELRGLCTASEQLKTLCCALLCFTLQGLVPLVSACTSRKVPRGLRAWMLSRLLWLWSPRMRAVRFGFEIRSNERHLALAAAKECVPGVAADPPARPPPLWFVWRAKSSSPLDERLQTCSAEPCDQRRMAPNHSLVLAEWFNGNPAKIIFL